jgi:glycine oxidase
VERFDVVVVGGGVIGLACALRARQRGLDVVVLERGRPGGGATKAAAGVLAPDPETPGFTALARRSAELWPAMAEELGDVGYTQCGSIVLAYEGETPDLAGEWLDRDTVLGLEPGVSGECAGGVLLADDAAVDPRRVVAALCASLGDAVRGGSDVVDLSAQDVELADGSRIGAERVVLAAGAWSARRLARRLPVRPVKGQTLRLRGPLPATRIIRSDHVYVVPRASGETVVGATVEEAGFDESSSETATAELLAGAARALPAIAGLELVEASVGLRPGTPDGGPLIGEWEGLVVAGGHFRNGILLAPITADAVAALVAGDDPPAEVEPFSPGRFA